MRIYFKQHQFLRRAFYSFPFQLLLMTFKKNFYYVLIWALFFGITTRLIGLRYGVPYLFLYPEYLNKVNFLSYLIMGFSCGGFIVAYNISSYVINSFRFPFLATLEKPFYVFFLNNLIIPVAFILTYVISVFHFRSFDNDPPSLIAHHILGFIIGILIFMAITIFFFYFFDGDLLNLFGTGHLRSSRIKEYKIKKDYELNILLPAPYLPLSYSDRTWYVETYLAGGLRLKLSRGTEHYDNRMLEKIFKQNHKTGAIFEIIAVASLLIMGAFRQNPIFMVPAGASLMLLFTVFIMMVGALHTWFRGWTTIVIIVLILGVDYFSRNRWSGFSAKAYGMNYDVPPAKYSYKEFKLLSEDTATRASDKRNMLQILKNREHEFYVDDTTLNRKPDLIMINTSGGGLRSALWTFYTLQYLDSITGGEFFRNTELITGSSGGVIGASYYRELYLEKQQGQNIDLNSKMYFDKLGKDILNPVAFTIATNDIAFRLQHFHDGNYTYTKDRAFAFEEKLDANTDSVLVKRLRDYKEPEQKAIIPMMFITPSIINDGRKLIISPQGISFMTDYDFDSTVVYEPLPQSVEFSRLFKNQDAQNLLFTSALRMSSTFPFITPITELPSSPPIEVMDAGLIDNLGLEETVKFIYTFRTWLSQHTRRIIIIQIRDQVKKQKIVGNSPTDMLGSITFPVSQLYGTLFSIESFKEDRILEYMSQWYKGKLNVVYFQLNNSVDNDISLSWRLTKHEKMMVSNSMQVSENKKAVKMLTELMK